MPHVDERVPAAVASIAPQPRDGAVVILPELASRIRYQAHFDRCTCGGDLENCKALKGEASPVEGAGLPARVRSGLSAKSRPVVSTGGVSRSGLSDASRERQVLRGNTQAEGRERESAQSTKRASREGIALAPRV